MPSKSKSLLVDKGSGGGGDNTAALRTALGSVNFYLPFFHYLTIPKNTTSSAYTSYRMPMPVSQSERLWIEFPEGCKGLAGLQVWRGVEQIFPLPAGVWLRSDGSTLNFRFSHVIDREPYEFELRGYNQDDTYPHTLWVGFEMHGLDAEISPGLREFVKHIEGV